MSFNGNCNQKLINFDSFGVDKLVGMIYNINCEKRIVFSIPFHFIFSSPTKLRSFLRSFVTFLFVDFYNVNADRKGRFFDMMSVRYKNSRDKRDFDFLVYLGFILFNFNFVLLCIRR